MYNCNTSQGRIHLHTGCKRHYEAASTLEKKSSQRFGIDQAINASKFDTPNRVASTYKKASNTTERQHPCLKILKNSTKKSDFNKNVCSLLYLISTLFKSQIVQKIVTKNMIILRHILVVLFLSKIIIKSKFIDLNLLKIVVCQTLLLFERFSSEYHLYHEML